MKYSLVSTTSRVSPCGIFHPREGRALRYVNWRLALAPYAPVTKMIEDGDDVWMYEEVDKFLVPGEML